MSYWAFFVFTLVLKYLTWLRHAAENGHQAWSVHFLDPRLTPPHLYFNGWFITDGRENEQFYSFDDFLCFDQRSSDRASKSAGFCINMRTHHLINTHGNKPVFVRCIEKKPHAFIPLVVGERDSESAYLKDRVEDACWWEFGSVPTCGLLIVYFKPFRTRTSLWSVRPQRTWLAFFLGRIQEHAKQTALWSLQSSQEGRPKVRHLSILSSCDRQLLTVKQIDEGLLVRYCCQLKSITWEVSSGHPMIISILMTWQLA